MSRVATLTVRGFKSIAQLEHFELRPLNVLIGANGCGKSNFLGVFRFLSAAVGDNFQVDVQKWGGPEALLHYGSKTTPQLDLEVLFTEDQGVTGFYQNGYRITLESTLDNRLIFTREEPTVKGRDYVLPKAYSLGAGHDSARIRSDNSEPSSRVSRHVLRKLEVWRQYHFHDTGDAAAVKRIHPIHDNLRLKPDAANLAAYLRLLATDAHYVSSYERIVETIRRAAPFFGNFVFREDASEFIELEWTERGRPDTPWKAHVLSDGTLRFICLTTLLLQPSHKRPDTVLIDEPELGLHPFAINLLAEMLHEAAESTQLVVSTQSAELLDALAPEDVIVARRNQGVSSFNRLDPEQLATWLADDYRLGDLWKRNILGGRPTR